MPRLASQNTSPPSTSEKATRVAASSGLTTPIRAMAEITAMMGGSTFHEPVFSIVKAAFAAALIRPAIAPGSRSAK